MLMQFLVWTTYELFNHLALQMISTQLQYTSPKILWIGIFFKGVRWCVQLTCKALLRFFVDEIIINVVSNEFWVSMVIELFAEQLVFHLIIHVQVYEDYWILFTPDKFFLSHALGLRLGHCCFCYFFPFEGQLQCVVNLDYFKCSFLTLRTS